ncbi:unnamed protein product [Arabidopsis halleri]
MLDKRTRGFGHRHGRSRSFGFEEHKEFVTHMESEGSFFDRQARMRLPANHTIALPQPLRSELQASTSNDSASPQCT